MARVFNECSQIPSKLQKLGLRSARLFSFQDQMKPLILNRSDDILRYLRVMFDIPSDNDPRVASQRRQQGTITMKQ